MLAASDARANASADVMQYAMLTSAMIGNVMLKVCYANSCYEW